MVVADGTKQVDDNRLQDNVAVAPGPLQPVSRGLRRGGNGGKLTPIKLDESNVQELVDSGTDDLASEDDSELTSCVANSCVTFQLIQFATYIETCPLQ